MKKTDWSILIATAAYSILFYKQLAGLNFLIFTLLLLVLFYLQNKTLLKNRQWKITALLSLLSGAMVFVHSSTLALWGNCISLLLLSACSINQNSSVIFNLFYSVYSVLGSFIFLIISLAIPKKETEDTTKTKGFKNAFTFIVPVLFILVFFLIYRSANPLFEKYTESINLDFISIEWLSFTLIGFLLVWGIVKHQRIKYIDAWENKLPLGIDANKKYSISKWDEKTAALILFAALNVMLLFINLLDANFLYLNSGMPEGINHSTFVHNGVGMLILSIVLAISTIMYFFRGGLNFSENIKGLKILVYLWIVQNIVMIISTMVRNNLYIQEFNLTYKRIGVYIWLLMAIIGLITTFIKIMKTRSNWYLFKSNSFLAYALLVLCSCIDWDGIISTYNIHHAKSMASLDKTYLISLSETNIPELLLLKQHKDVNTDSAWHYARYNDVVSNESYHSNNLNNIDTKLYKYLSLTADKGWRSWSIRQNRIHKELIRMNNEHKILQLDLGNNELSSLKPLCLLTNLEALKFSDCLFDSLQELELFPRLKKLDLNGNTFTTDFSGLKYLPRLNYLNLENTKLNNTIFIFDKVFLTDLYLKNCYLNSLKGIEKLGRLEQLSLSQIKETDVFYLKNLKSLKTFYVSQTNDTVIDHLKLALPACNIITDNENNTPTR